MAKPGTGNWNSQGSWNLTSEYLLFIAAYAAVSETYHKREMNNRAGLLSLPVPDSNLLEKALCSHHAEECQITAFSREFLQAKLKGQKLPTLAWLLVHSM